MEHQLKRKKYIISTEKYKKEPILLSLTVFISVFVRLEIETFSVFFFLFFSLVPCCLIAAKPAHSYQESSALLGLTSLSQYAAQQGHSNQTHPFFSQKNCLIAHWSWIKYLQRN